MSTQAEDRPQTSPLVSRLSAAGTLHTLPEVVSLATDVPANPPQEIQQTFVGSSYEEAYGEAETFVEACGGLMGGWPAEARVLDFGSGWGRITRLLLPHVDPTRLHLLDVDPAMTALVNQTLPGTNAMTVAPMPPSHLAEASIDVGVAFSVFSHLSPQAHEAWAKELGAVIKPGGWMFITVLDASFFGTLAGAVAAVAAGDHTPFAAAMAGLFPDVEVARRHYAAGQLVYAGNGGGGVRTGDFYGWAAAPRGYVSRNWGAAGFTLEHWIPQGELFQQALVGLRRSRHPRSVALRTRARSTAGTVRRSLRTP
jgi:hypothetical protein